MHNVFLLARRTYQKMSDTSKTFKIFKTYLRYLDLCIVEQWLISVQVWLMELASCITLHHLIVFLRTALAPGTNVCLSQGK